MLYKTVKQKPRIEFWRGDDRWKASIHVHWNWRGFGYWWLLFI